MKNFNLSIATLFSLAFSGLAMSASPAYTNSTKQMEAVMLGYKHLDDRIKILESGKPIGGSSDSGLVASQIRDLQSRVHAIETETPMREGHKRPVSGPSSHPSTYRLSAIEEDLARVIMMEADLRAQFKLATEAVTSSDSETRLGKRIVALERKLVKIESAEAENQMLSMQVAELKEANALLIDRVNEQMAQVQELIATARRLPPPQPTTFSGTGGMIDSSALMRSAKEAASGSALPPVNCQSLSGSKEKDWALASKHALPTHRFVKLDAEAGIVWTLAPDGEAQATSMAIINKGAGC